MTDKTDQILADILTTLQRSGGGAFNSRQANNNAGNAGGNAEDKATEIRRQKQTSGFYTSVRQYNQLVKNQNKSVDLLRDQVSYSSRFMHQAVARRRRRSGGSSGGTTSAGVSIVLRSLTLQNWLR